MDGDLEALAPLVDVVPLEGDHPPTLTGVYGPRVPIREPVERCLTRIARRRVLAAGLSAPIVVGLVAAGCGGTRTVTKTVTVAPPEATGRPDQIAQFGYVKSLTRKGGAYELRFDPAWFLSGRTANVAAAEDQGLAPGEPIPPVPNDNYVLDEGHRLLTYRVPADARVTVLTRHGPGPLGATPVSVAELARIVNGGRHRPLFEPISTGFWIRVDNDTVRSLDQQYRP